MNHQRIAFTGDFHPHAIDVRKLSSTATYRNTAKRIRFALCILRFNINRVGVFIFRLGKRHDSHVHARLVG